MKNHTAVSAHVPVLIVGGGVTGLSAALFLLKHKVTPYLIERHAAISIHPRARGFDTRTMELMRELRLADAIREAGRSLGPSWGILTDNSLAKALKKKKRMPGKKMEFPSQMKGLEALAAMSPETGARCTQDLSEPILLQAAKDRGAQLSFGTELLSFHQDEAGVTAVLKQRDNGRQYEVRADYLIAADGASSKIRETIQAECEGPGPLGRLLNIYFEADLGDFVRGREFSILRIDRPEIKGFLSAINNSNKWAFQLYYDPAKGERPEDFTNERLVPILQSVIGLPDVAIRIISILPWYPTVNVVREMQHGRVFLAGDAAHVMTPYGGKGANTGIQDVHNLAWKLAAVIHGKAGAGILSTYNAERRPVGWYNAVRSGKMADKNGLLKKKSITFILPFIKAILIRKAHLNHLFPKSSLKHLGYLMGLPHYRYVSRAVISAQKPAEGFVPCYLLKAAAGTRMPHLWVTYKGRTVSTLDVVGDEFVLFTGEDNMLWKRIAATAADKFGVKIAVYSLGTAGTLTFAGSGWRKMLGGISESGAVLVRPDGFVAWNTEAMDFQSLNTLENILAQILSININVKKSNTAYQPIV